MIESRIAEVVGILMAITTRACIVIGRRRMARHTILPADLAVVKTRIAEVARVKMAGTARS